MPTAASEQEKLVKAVQAWADGKATLKEVRGYTDEELYAVARTGYTFFHQGKIAEARTIFQGLFAVNPRDPWLARALAVVEYAAGSPETALSAWDVAVKLDPSDISSYLGRAEVLLASGQKQKAVEDLRRAAGGRGDERLKIKAKSMLDALRGR
jgi:predicted Zn-dependent protease